MSEFVDVNVDGGVMTIQFMRPEKKNALLVNMYEAVNDAMDKAESDPSIRVLVFTGSGDSFTAGNDIADFLARPPGMDGSSPVSQFLLKLISFPKPMLAAVNGMAVGVGVTMLLHCDMVYAATDAKFTYAFVNIGAVPEAGSSYLMPNMVGHAKAAELFMLGEPFSAEMAKTCFIVNDVVEGDDLMTHVMGVAKKLAAKPPATLRKIKKLMKTDHGNVANAMATEGEVFAECLQSAEAREAMTAFMERRAPDFSNFE
ncbi:MAG: enoyl-CoA hydratase [Sphingomonadales bacterium]|nr:enoyl-CoA hydratase [Sphingomonadales bacterium]